MNMALYTQKPPWVNTSMASRALGPMGLKGQTKVPLLMVPLLKDDCAVDALLLAVCAILLVY